MQLLCGYYAYFSSDIPLEGFTLLFLLSKEWGIKHFSLCETDKFFLKKIPRILFALAFGICATPTDLNEIIFYNACSLWNLEIEISIWPSFTEWVHLHYFELTIAYLLNVPLIQIYDYRCDLFLFRFTFLHQWLINAIKMKKKSIKLFDKDDKISELFCFDAHPHAHT